MATIALSQQVINSELRIIPLSHHKINVNDQQPIFCDNSNGRSDILIGIIIITWLSNISLGGQKMLIENPQDLTTYGDIS